VAAAQINGRADQERVDVVRPQSLQIAGPGGGIPGRSEGDVPVVRRAKLPLKLGVLAVEHAPVGAAVLQVVDEWRREGKERVETVQWSVVFGIFGGVSSGVAADDLVVISPVGSEAGELDGMAGFQVADVSRLLQEG